MVRIPGWSIGSGALPGAVSVRPFAARKENSEICRKASRSSGFTANAILPRMTTVQQLNARGQGYLPGLIGIEFISLEPLGLCSGWASSLLTP
jgi:hypothetical protein